MDSAGSGSRTANPWATSIHGFQRHDQAFHDPSGPPCAHSTSGAGQSADVPVGRANQARTRTPSSAVVSTSSRVPGSAGVAAGDRSSVTAPSTSVIRTGCGGTRYDERSAWTTSPSGAGRRSV
ncbi:hypothetical protein QE397_001105 [Rhodococcus sp. SORGH_AS 301]|nr:hypothetical protein [Rhodococcus sp. SORGH_AS_0301]